QPKDLAELRDNPDIRLIQFPVPWPYYLGMNNTMPPFDNVKVRQAVCYAVPYKTIIDKVLYGFGQECKSPVAKGQPTSDFSFWKYDTDPAKAKQLLEEAGVSKPAVRPEHPTGATPGRADRCLDSVRVGRSRGTGHHQQDDGCGVVRQV